MLAEPAMHPVSASTLSASSRGIAFTATTSEIARRPPGFSTRNASRKTAALSVRG
jgi:hypothetical protein